MPSPWRLRRCPVLDFKSWRSATTIRGAAGVAILKRELMHQRVCY